MTSIAPKTALPSSVMQAIPGRRSARAYKPDAVSHGTVVELLRSAVKATSAMHGEPGAFAVTRTE